MPITPQFDLQSVIFSLTPLLVCALSLLVFRRTVQFSAFAGMALCLALTYTVPSYNVLPSQLMNAVLSALLLSLSAALVIVPGLYFNATLRLQGALPKIVSSLKEVRIQPPYKILIILLGILPAVESLTGFGVCLLLGVPIYCSLMNGQKAARLSMLSMNIMPWATLTIATLVGAGLVHQAPSLLSRNTAIISSAIFPMLGLIALYVWNGKEALIRFGWYALMLGIFLPAMLYIMSYLGAGEAVGIVSGAMTAALGIIVSYLIADKSHQTQSMHQKFNKEKFELKILLPYVLLIGLVLITRMIPSIYEAMNSIFVFKSSRVQLHLLASPGVIIGVVTVMMLIAKPVSIDHSAIFIRSKNLLIGLVCFILISQIMLENGMVTTVSNALCMLPGNLLYIASPAIGMFSGFLAGSGLGGNAMMMLMQQQIGQVLHAENLLTAIQNSSAGHTAFTSLPFILLTKTILQEYTKDVPMDGEMLSFGLKVAFILFIVFVSTIFIVRQFASLLF